MPVAKVHGNSSAKPRVMKTRNILYANFSFDCFSNICTFQDTFEGLQDVNAGSKLVDISY